MWNVVVVKTQRSTRIPVELGAAARATRPRRREASTCGTIDPQQRPAAAGGRTFARPFAAAVAVAHGAPRGPSGGVHAVEELDAPDLPLGPRDHA